MPRAWTRSRRCATSDPYLLYRDTDIDFYLLGGGSRSHRFGADFSRNLGTNLEVHGEWARVSSQEFQFVDPTGTITRDTHAATSWLVGLRYLSERETTWIAELYRNGTGYDRVAWRAFAALADQAAAAGRGSAPFQRAQSLAGSYGRQSPMRDYFFLRVSQKEPFDILYFTPALTTIVNLEDRSWSITPELLYTGFKDVELRARATLLQGGAGTDFGEKQNKRRIELLARFFF